MAGQAAQLRSDLDPAAVVPSSICRRRSVVAELRWAGDPEGDAAFVEADPAQPEKIIGFDVEIAQLFARRLKPQSNFVNITFTSIDQSIRRGDADFGLSGIEDTQVRRETMTATVPTTGSAKY